MALAQRQRIPASEKNADWKINNLKYFYERCRPYNAHFDALYRAAIGELDITEYSYFLNPWGNVVQDRPELQSYPAKMRNIPIIPEIFNKLIGEMRDRPLIKSVTVSNPDMMNKKRFEENEILKKHMQQVYINTLEELGYDTGEEAKPVEPIDSIMKRFSDNWVDSRVITGQEVLNFICDDLDIPEKFIEAFKNWVVTSCVYTIKDVIGDDVVYDVVNPSYVGFIKDDSTKFIEDAEAAMVIRRFTRASFIDRYSEIIFNDPDYEEILDYFDKPERHSVDNIYTADGYFTSSYQGADSFRFTRDGNFTWLGDTVEVGYINWTSEELVKVVAVPNAAGEYEQIDMPEDYQVDEAAGEYLVEEFWRTCKWEGYTVDKNKFFFGCRQIPIQRNKLNRKSKCKNLINGRVKLLGNRRQLSIVELLMPFQHLYNIIHYKLMNILAKNKERLLVLPVGVLPKYEGWDIHTTMYHADATGILWVDESNEQAQIALNSIKSIDMSLGNIISETLGLLNAIKAQAESMVGMSPQRKGQVGNRDGASTTQLAQAQSYQISEDLFAEFEKFQENELNGLLDISRYAYINGKRASYVTSEGRLAILELEEGLGDFVNAEIGVRVKNASSEKKKMEKMEMMAETLASQKANPSMLATILQTETMNELVDKLAAIEEMERNYEAQNAQAQRDHEKAMSDASMKIEQDRLNLEYYKVDANNDTKKEVELIKADTTMMGMDLDKNGVADSLQITQQALARDKQFFDQTLAQSKLQQESDKVNHTKKVEAAKLELEKAKLKQGDKKLSMEKYKADMSYKIAKENKNKHDVKK